MITDRSEAVQGALLLKYMSDKVVRYGDVGEDTALPTRSES